MIKASLEEAALPIQHIHTVDKTKRWVSRSCDSNSKPHGLPSLARRALFCLVLWVTVPMCCLGYGKQLDQLMLTDHAVLIIFTWVQSNQHWETKCWFILADASWELEPKILGSLELAEAHGYTAKSLFQPLVAVHLITWPVLQGRGRGEKNHQLGPHDI